MTEIKGRYPLLSAGHAWARRLERRLRASSTAGGGRTSGQTGGSSWGHWQLCRRRGSPRLVRSCPVPEVLFSPTRSQPRPIDVSARPKGGLDRRRDHNRRPLLGYRPGLVSWGRHLTEEAPTTVCLGMRFGRGLTLTWTKADCASGAAQSLGATVRRASQVTAVVRSQNCHPALAEGIPDQLPGPSQEPYFIRLEGTRAVVTPRTQT